MNKILGTGLQIALVTGISIILYGFFKQSNFNEVFGIVLCICTTYCILDTIRKLVNEVEDER